MVAMLWIRVAMLLLLLRPAPAGALVDLTLYGGAFDSSSIIAYAEVVQTCFGGLEVGSCEPSSPNWLIDFLDQYNEGTSGAYCAACCSNTDVSGDTWTFTCPLISTAFAEFVNVFGWEFRFGRRESIDDKEVVTCPIPRTACVYDEDGVLTAPCESDGSFLSGYVLSLDVMTIERSFSSWKSVQRCSVETQESDTQPAELAETITMAQVFANDSGIEAGWAVLIALVALLVLSCGIRYARDDRCTICGHHLIWFRRVCLPCNFFGYVAPSKEVAEVIQDKRSVVLPEPTLSERIGTVKASTTKHNYDGINMSEGSLGFPQRITCSTKEGRVWFARAWMHIANFNHLAAVECFKSCTEADPDCAMAWWGIAHAVGSNYNFPPGFSNGFDSIQHALKIVQTQGSKFSELEIDLIEAMTARSSAESKAAFNPAEMNFGNTPELNLSYSDAMAKLGEKYPDDLDVTALYAESLMVLNPWVMWVKRGDHLGEIVPTDGKTLIAKTILERAMSLPGGMEHPIVLHLYCHLMELSNEPLAATAAAESLRTKFLRAGHLIHMASHIDIWGGRYKAALDANIVAIAADNVILECTGGDDTEGYFGYRIHNLHMAVWAAMFTGQADIAVETARQLEDMLPPGDENSGVQYMAHGVFPVGAMFYEPYSGIKWHAMIRFGLWDAIIAEPLPENPEIYPTGTATAHYARGIAFASQGLIAQAEEEQAKYLEGMNAGIEGRKIHNNFIMSDDEPCLFKVGEAMLAGEIEYRKGNLETAFEHLREAVRLDTGLVYDEPWGWMVPTRHALGALLLEQNHVEEATEVFRADLSMYPKNMWGLLGLYQCLERAGMGSDPETIEVKKSYGSAASAASNSPQATCFCAKAAGAVSLVG
eukprot:g11259.t1